MGGVQLLPSFPGLVFLVCFSPVFSLLPPAAFSWCRRLELLPRDFATELRNLGKRENQERKPFPDGDALTITKFLGLGQQGGGAHGGTRGGGGGGGGGLTGIRARRATTA